MTFWQDKFCGEGFQLDILTRSVSKTSKPTPANIQPSIQTNKKLLQGCTPKMFKHHRSLQPFRPTAFLISAVRTFFSTQPRKTIHNTFTVSTNSSLVTKRLIALLQRGSSSSTPSLWLLPAPPLEGKLWKRAALSPRFAALLRWPPRCPRCPIAAPHPPPWAGDRARPPTAPPSAPGPRPPPPGGRFAPWQLRRGLPWRTMAVRGTGA